MAGTVEAVGRNVTQFGPGDDVWADLFPLGGGSFAEYVAGPQTAFVLRPPGFAFEDAAAVPHSGLLALQALRSWGGVKSGQRVLVNGGGGCVGPFVIQLAKSFGTEVTGVDEIGKLDLMRAAGADHVIDYTQENFTKRKGGYDFIVDIAANRWVPANRRALASKGTYVQIARSLSGFFGAVAIGGLVTLVSDRRMGIFMWEPNKRRDLEFLAGLLEDGALKPIIDRSYPLASVPDALRYQESGSARGKLVIVP
jgi:NADPH:quinone reductase-like Zn-dependent oxidoreductase